VYESSLEYVRQLQSYTDETNEALVLNYLTHKVYSLASSPSITDAMTLIKALA
jgi:hypothetical protein